MAAAVGLTLAEAATVLERRTMTAADLTTREAVAILEPAISVKQLRALIAITGIQPAGTRRTGQTGRPAVTYDAAAIMREHGTEAQRTAKQFTDQDWLGAALLGRGLITTDTDAGTITWPDGSRAEELTANLYGAIRIGQVRCMAHRVIWMAADGPIPPGIVVNHRNRLRWDNRRANLELVTIAHNIRHAHGSDYLTIHQAADQLAQLDALPSQPAMPRESLSRAGGAWRHDASNCGG